VLLVIVVLLVIMVIMHGVTGDCGIAAGAGAQGH